jgi:thiamine biosynthesis lipoprotein
MAHELVDRTFSALGTEVRLVVMGAGAASLASQAEEAVLDYHARLSRFLPDSELCALNDDPRRRVPASALLREAVAAGLWAARHSGGLVDPCLLGALERAGYRSSLSPGWRRPVGRALPPRGASRPARPHPGAAWRRLRVDESERAIVRPTGLRLDLGGSGKGHVADRVARTFAAAERWIVDCGGDLRVGGAGILHEVHVAHPLGDGVAARLWVSDAAVATSSVASRAWTNRDGSSAHHLLDPSTGEPAWTGLLAATAIATTTLEAETLAKMALLSGAAGARRALAPGGGLFVHADGKVERVGRLPEMPSEAPPRQRERRAPTWSLPAEVVS